MPCAGLCPMPYALCPMPYALLQIVPHVIEKGYILALELAKFSTAILRFSTRAK
jgi:hypothetical protein